VASYLARGDFTLLNYIDQDVPYLSFPDYAKPKKPKLLNVTLYSKKLELFNNLLYSSMNIRPRRYFQKIRTSATESIKS